MTLQEVLKLSDRRLLVDFSIQMGIFGATAGFQWDAHVCMMKHISYAPVLETIFHLPTRVRISRSLGRLLSPLSGPQLLARIIRIDGGLTSCVTFAPDEGITHGWHAVRERPYGTRRDVGASVMPDEVQNQFQEGPAGGTYRGHYVYLRYYLSLRHILSGNGYLCICVVTCFA